jgi:hypothetical protein
MTKLKRRNRSDEPWEVQFPDTIEIILEQRENWSAKQRSRHAATADRGDRLWRRGERDGTRKRRPRPAAARRERNQVLRAMRPSAWYTTLDVAARAGIHYRAVQPVLQQQLAEETVERMDNPAWSAGATLATPRTLWRLTLKGEIFREVSIFLG